MKKDIKVLSIPVVREKMLGVNVYRGFSELGQLAELSSADIYDQVNNPKGTQRDLSISHAKDAYIYIKDRDFGFWPEVFLCARNKGIITYHAINDEFPNLGLLEINLKMFESKKEGEIFISRVDGNHRLHYSDGKTKGFSRINKTVSFCLAYDLTLEEEIQLFKDINKNQKPMNTSHLDKIEVKLTPEEELKRRQPELYIAQKLGNDSSSPLYGKIYEGGRKPVGVDIPLRSLKTGIEYLKSRSTQLPHLEDVEAEYKLIRNYFDAVKLWQPNAWVSNKEYLMMRGTGLWALCFLGATVIDSVLLQKKYQTQDMLTLLQSGGECDWSRNGDFKGYSGRGGALQISKSISLKLRMRTIFQLVS